MTLGAWIFFIGLILIVLGPDLDMIISAIKPSPPPLPPLPPKPEDKMEKHLERIERMTYLNMLSKFRRRAQAAEKSRPPPAIQINIVAPDSAIKMDDKKILTYEQPPEPPPKKTEQKTNTSPVKKRTGFRAIAQNRIAAMKTRSQVKSKLLSSR